MARAIILNVKEVFMKNVDPYIATLWKWTVAMILMALCAVHAVGAEPEAQKASGDSLLAGKHQTTAEALNQKIEWGGEVNKTPKTSEPQSINIVSAMTQMFLGLMFVIAIMVGAAWAYRRWGRRLVHQQMGRQHMELIESMSIGVKRQVTLVRVADQVLVLGQGEHEISTLSSMSVEEFEAAAPKDVKTSDEDTQIMDTPDLKEQPKLQVFKQKLADILQKPS